MNFRKGQQTESPEINLIPFIDVLLVILIFLMITTTYNKFTELQITLPSAEAVKAQKKPLEINVGVDIMGHYAINNRRINVKDVNALAIKLKETAAMLEKNAIHSDSPPIVIINADANSSHQKVINVLEAARLAGLEKVTFVAQQ